MSLQNPTSADHIAAQEGSFEPQRQNNFSLEIPLPNADKDLIVMALEGFDLPKQGNEVITLQYQNESRKVAGPVTVDQGALHLKDFVDADVRGAILRWRKQVYDPSTGKIGLAKDYKKTCNVILTAPDGSSQRIAQLEGVFPPEDPPNNFTMTSGDKVLMDVPISIDKIKWSGSILGA